MKVLLILDNPDEGDVARAALDVCRNTNRFGIEMAVALLSPGVLGEEFASSGADLFLVHRESALDLNCVYRIRKIVKELGVSIIHSMGSMEALHSSLATLANRSVKRVLSYPPVTPDEGAVSGRFGLKALAKMMDANLLPLRLSFKALRRIGIDTSGRFFYLPPGVDRVRLLPAGKNFRDELGLDRSNVLLGTSARFDPSVGNDQMTICKALPKIFEKYPEARFVFAGGASESGDQILEDCAEYCDRKGMGDKVFFTGETIEVNRLMDSLDLFVYSARKDALPLSLLEAMTVGVPAIVSDTEALVELTGLGKCADVFVRGDSAELANKAISLIKNPKLRKMRSEESAALAAALYSIESHVSSLKTLYTELDASLAERRSKSSTEEIGTEEGNSFLGLE